MHNRESKNEKAKDFKGAIKRLLKELKRYNILILISLILACLSATLSISAPDRLSKLTDEISKGLVINTKSFETLTKKVTTNLQKELPNLLQMNLTQNNIISIMSDPNISDKDKNKFNKIISDKENISKNITKIPNSILNKLLNDSYYKNTLITKEDKINLLKNNKIPSNLKDILFEDITVKKTKITSNDQVKFLEVLSSIDKNTKNTKVYKKLDKMPKSVRKVIEPNMNMQRVKKITIYLIIIYIISALFSFSQSFIMTTVSNRFAQ